MTTALPDIQTEDHVRTMVLTFYDRVQLDPMLGPIFNDIAHVDWPKHLPTMVDFWSGVLLGNGRYRGRPFPPHAALPIGAEHFSRWLNLFFIAVDANFAGPKAEEAKTRAISIASIFKHRLGLSSELTFV